MSTSKTVAERALEYLSSHDEWKRPSEVADAIGSNPNYTREVLRELHEADEVEKKSEPGGVIGHIINDDTVVIETRAHAERVIKNHGSLSKSEMSAMSFEELRSHIESNIAEDSVPLGKKVWYKGK